MSPYLDWFDSCGKLIQRSGIPNREIWLKLGGDHGGGSFKFVMQIANVATPNSLSNTIPLCVFEGQDTQANLDIALGMYCSEVETLRNSAKWKGHSFHVFFFADYDFQTKSYGLSGSSGAEPCLHCLCPKKNMDTPPADRLVSDAAERTLETLAADHAAFVAAGSVHSRAKEFQNVIRPVILPVAVADVIIPALHLDLGIFPWIFSCFEGDLQRLDVRLASCVACADSDQSSFAELSNLHVKLRDVTEKIASSQAALDEIQ